MVPSSPRSSSKPSASSRARSDVVGIERERDDGLALATTHRIGPAARAERKIQRAEQHRLARPGLAGEDRRALGELDVGASDQTVVLDLQSPQHGGFR